MNTLFIGKNLIQLESVSSTNLYAQKMLHDVSAIPDGTVVNAFCQTDGRGQRGNKWQSMTGESLTFSIVLYPRFLLIEEQFLLSIAVSLGICDYCNSLLTSQMVKPIRKSKVKWPNDIFIGTSKVAGVLIENNSRSTGWGSSIVGIGLNVNQLSFELSLGQPTSLRLETQIKWNVKDVLKDLLCFIEARYLQLRAEKKDLLQEDYLRFLYQYKSWGNYLIKGVESNAMIIGVTKVGKLILETKNGNLIECDNKEVVYLK